MSDSAEYTQKKEQNVEYIKIQKLYEELKPIADEIRNVNCGEFRHDCGGCILKKEVGLFISTGIYTKMTLCFLIQLISTKG